MKETQKIIMRDSWDEDIFHICYKWQMNHIEGLPKRFNKRHAATIHIDDIESIFGQEFHRMAAELECGNWADAEFIGTIEIEG